MKVIEILSVKKIPESSSSRIDLELLISAAINKSREFIYTNSDYELNKDEEEKFNNLYQRRLIGEPIAYILGKKEFWSLELDINNKVLIPRPETELLVEIILKEVVQKEVDIVDLGTGSGAIALAIAAEKPLWNIVATDVSDDALQAAKHNANKFNLKNVKFYQGSWCSALPDKKFDVIVSNPPYIGEKDPHLLQGDVKFEPKIALESGDGLVDIKKIAEQAKSKLKPTGFLALEHGHNQGEQVQEILRQYGYQLIRPHQDFAGIDRVVIASCFSTAALYNSQHPF